MDATSNLIITEEYSFSEFHQKDGIGRLYSFTSSKNHIQNHPQKLLMKNFQRKVSGMADILKFSVRFL